MATPGALDVVCSTKPVYPPSLCTQRVLPARRTPRAAALAPLPTPDPPGSLAAPASHCHSEKYAEGRRRCGTPPLTPQGATLTRLAEGPDPVQVAQGRQREEEIAAAPEEASRSCLVYRVDNGERVYDLFRQ